MVLLNYGTGSVWQISTKTKVCDITLPYGNLHVPHANVANFSKTFANGNEDLPLLYVSQWNNEGACFVYDIHLDGTCNLVQTITTSNMGSDFGTTLGDFVLDNKNGYLWSAKYKVSAYHAEGNAMMFCKFNIPDISKSTVTLTQADIIDHFSIPSNEADLTVTQDKVISDNGDMFIGVGFGNAEYPAKIYVVSLEGKNISSVVDLQSSISGEPEGIDIVGNSLIYSSGSGNLLKLNF